MNKQLYLYLSPTKFEISHVSDNLSFGYWVINSKTQAKVTIYCIFYVSCKEINGVQLL